MLLSYFKPELADNPKQKHAEFPERVTGVFDPMTQSEDLHIDYATRTIADPAPDTSDLVAATAAIIRAAVREAVERHGGKKIDLLLIGEPSYQSAAEESRRSSDRRLEAVALAGIAAEFGSEDFRVELIGEAEAAGFAFDVQAEADEVYSIIIDVGAGTTDLALVPYRRDRSGRHLASAPMARDSMRLAGRNINEAIARGLREDPAVETAYKAMDDRAWQLLLDTDIERIKRAIGTEEKQFGIPFSDYAAAPDNNMWHNPERQALKRTVFVNLSTNTSSIQKAVSQALEPWSERVSGFIAGSTRMLGSRDLVAIELVGGAFQFAPLRRLLEDIVCRAGSTHIETRYRAEGGHSQTAVARGLARRAALME